MAHLMLREQVIESVRAERLRCAITGSAPPNVYAELEAFEAFLVAEPRRATREERERFQLAQSLGLTGKGG